MAFRWQWLLILFAFAVGGGQGYAAGTREDRAFQAAQSAFHDEMWSRAETEFADFVQKYPDSPSMPLALLLQAQAEFNQGDFTNVIQVLTLNHGKAGKLADQYVNWVGEAQYAASNYTSAAETFTKLAQTSTNSSLQLPATVSAAAARAQLGQWPMVEELLDATNGIFQLALQSDADSRLALRGQLLRAQARFAQADFSGAARILESKKVDVLPPDLAWNWQYLLCQSRNMLGDLPALMSDSTNLIQIARVAQNDDWLAKSVSFRAGLLETSHLTNDAVAAYLDNLTRSNTPAGEQRLAILKIAGLSATQLQFTNAELALNNFRAQFPNSPAADAALYSLGDLQLKDYAAHLNLTNLVQAQASLDQFLAAYTNSEYLGNVYLDHGWCNWCSSNYVDSAADFKLAVAHLPKSLAQAIAHFKLGDARFKQNNYPDALENYRIVVDDFMDFPEVVQQLQQRALYQSLRVSEAMDDFITANRALERIIKLYPDGYLSDNATLFLGETLAGSGRLDDARKLFRQFTEQFPHSELLPEAKLAVARTYEQQGNWTAAITNYDSWLQEFPTNALRAKAIYSDALANYHAGYESNALVQLTGFITQFPTNDELAPQAQWWVADYFFRANNFAGAETNYENIFQNPAWKNSPLAYQAQMMAGRAAMARNGYPDATRYFTSLISDTNCPADLGVQARFACAAAWVQIPSADNNNPQANYLTANSFLTQIVMRNATNDATARAWGEIGKCDFQMKDYDAATNAFAQVFSRDAPPYAAADVSTRSAAQFGYGLALEKRAESVTGSDQTNLLQQALNAYLDLFDTNVGKNLRDGESADPFWVKKAGLEALPLIQALGVANPNKFIDQMEILLPPLKDSLEKTRLTLLTKK